jgi:hypothetical protein
MKLLSHYLLFIVFIIFIYFGIATSAGKVYLVLGSDTAIWDGMSVSRYHCTYDLSLYTNPSRNANKVMDPAFRSQFLDSYGEPLKMTWWMMAGNIFRYATNRNMPIPNIMTMYLMQKYYGDEIQQNGDELSLHYHTFGWTDYDGDGMWWWNQTHTFLECLDDFNFTLCQFLLEENVFPVSFRSGWHFMDNDWQHYLDQLLPYSMHNDWPVHGIDVTEPLDNNYDWSQAPQEWVPFHPCPENYQLPGNGRGWNVRSAHLSTTRYRDYLHEIFKQAHEGVNQVACIWGHLPEEDFLSNIQKIDSVAHYLAAQYPDVKFHYCTAIEAMQRWLKTNDSEAPVLTIEEQGTGDEVFYIINTNEPIFQTRPFVAVKDVYERYFILPCNAIGQNAWRTAQSLTKNILAKVGVVVCDTVGNQSMDFIQYLPDDIFVDNLDAGYVEESGNWAATSNNAWGMDSRMISLVATDTVRVKWIPDIPQSGYYNIFVQVPKIDDPASQLNFKIYDNGEPVDTTIFTQPMPSQDWIYIGTAFLTAHAPDYLEMTAYGHNQTGKIVAADVAKFSALVRERDLYVDQNLVSLGEVSQDDTVSWNLKIANRGYKKLTIFNCSSTNQFVLSQEKFPVEIAGMSSFSLPFQFYSRNIGTATDMLFIQSDDPIEPYFSIPVTATVKPFFITIDNEDSLYYQEFGSWYTSNAQAYGPSSRYGWLNQSPPSFATFTTMLNISGNYEIFEIVPSTVNASNYAVYMLSVSDVVVDSMVIDQNIGSGSWVSLGKYELPADHKIELKVVDTGKNTNPNSVLRADAIKFALISESSGIASSNNSNQPFKFQLAQNYPNPFNSNTTIRYTIPKETKVQLRILNLLGQEIAKLVDEQQGAGIYSINWEAKNLASGIYLYQLKTDGYCQVRKLTIIR